VLREELEEGFGDGEDWRGHRRKAAAGGFGDFKGGIFGNGWRCSYVCKSASLWIFSFAVECVGVPTAGGEPWRLELIISRLEAQKAGLSQRGVGESELSVPTWPFSPLAAELDIRCIGALKKISQASVKVVELPFFVAVRSDEKVYE
jgi:hypothetical protein